MKVAWVELENYGSFSGVHRFGLSGRGLTLVLGKNLDEPRMDSNGSAKSTLFESLDWCWYGKVPRDDHVDSVVNDHAKGCAVTCQLEDEDGTVAVIKRTRPAGLQFWRNGVEVTNLDAAQTQKAIESFLGLEREVFRSTVFFAQGDLFHFADVGDARRIEIVSKIIPEVGAVDDYLDPAKARRAATEAAWQAAQREAQRFHGQLEALQSRDFAGQISGWEASRLARISSKEQLALDKRRWVDGALVHLSGLEALRGEAVALEAPLSENRDPAIASWVAYRAKCLEVEKGVLSEAAVVDAEIRRAATALSSLERLQVGSCPQCGQPVSKEHLQVELLRLNQEKAQHHLRAEEVAARRAAVQRDLATCQETFQAIERQQAQAQADRRRALEKVRWDLQKLEELQRTVIRERSEIEALEREVAELRVAANPFLDEQRKLEIEKGRAQSDFLQAEALVAQQAAALKVDEYLVAAFGPKGLKSYILDAKLQELTESANHWVKLLTGGTFWVRFETQKMGRASKKLSNQLTLRVFRYNPDGRIVERDYRSWSGGEKKRVSLAVDFGLSQLVSRRAKKRYDLLVLDEVFRHVDSAGGEAILEMLQELRSERSSIFVIEHDADFKSRFENRVLVEKQGGKSRIVEVECEQETKKLESRPSKSTEEEREQKPKRAPRRRPVSSRPNSL